MGSIAEFPNAHIYIQKSELLSWYEAFALPTRFAHLTAIVDPDNMRTALDASIAHRVTLIDGDKNNVLPGIHVRLGSGHTIGQQFVIIETKAGRQVISGDCVYSRRQFTGHNNDGVYVPLNNAVGSVWEQLKTIDKMNDELGGDLSRLVVLHDIERWKGHTVVEGSRRIPDRQDRVTRGHPPAVLLRAPFTPQRMRHVGLLQRRDFLGRQLQRQARDRVVEMLQLRGADDRRGDLRLLQHPGQRDLRAGNASRLRDRGDALDHRAGRPRASCV